MQIKYEGLWRLDFIDLQTFRTHIQDITCLNQIINYRGYTFLNMQPEFRLTHISHEVILRSIDGQFSRMVFGNDFQGSGEVFRIKHGLKCFGVYYLSFFMQI